MLHLTSDRETRSRALDLQASCERFRDLVLRLIDCLFRPSGQDDLDSLRHDLIDELTILLEAARRLHEGDNSVCVWELENARLGEAFRAIFLDDPSPNFVISRYKDVLDVLNRFVVSSRSLTTKDAWFRQDTNELVRDAVLVAAFLLQVSRTRSALLNVLESGDA